jgi:hypothetical protein
MLHKRYNQRNVTRGMWDKPRARFTKDVKNIRGTSKVAAENKMSQSYIQTKSSYKNQ